MKKVMNYILENYFEINKEGVQTIKFPLILFAIVFVVGLLTANTYYG